MCIVLFVPYTAHSNILILKFINLAIKYVIYLKYVSALVKTFYSYLFLFFFFFKCQWLIGMFQQGYLCYWDIQLRVWTTIVNAQNKAMTR